MKVLAVDPDAISFLSAYWQTTCTAIRVGEEGFLIDSPVYPHELEALPQVLDQAGFPVSGLLSTHADWDHLLGRLAFPQASLGCGEATAERLRTHLGEPQRELRAFDEEQYVDRGRPLMLGDVQALPVPGRLDLGDQELELQLADGHTADGTAYFFPWLGVLVCGDYLSPVEIPMISPGGSIETYRSTLERLQPLVARASTVVPGHGAPQPRDQALRILEEDAAYVAELSERGPDAPLPAGRRTPTQRRIHQDNVRGLT